MQRHKGGAYPPRRKRGHGVVVEVQPGGRRGDGARIAREHRLVVGAVCGVRLAAQIRRNGRPPYPLQRRQQIRPGKRKPQQHFAPRPAAGDFRLQPVQFQRVPVPQLAGRFRQRAPRSIGQLPVQHQFDVGGAARRPPHPEQSGRNHAGIVEHQQVAGRQFVRQIADMSVAQPVALYHQHAGDRPGANRAGGDLPGRQFEIEPGNIHRCRAPVTRRVRRIAAPSASPPPPTPSKIRLRPAGRSLAPDSRQ